MFDTAALEEHVLLCDTVTRMSNPVLRDTVHEKLMMKELPADKQFTIW
jgi:hypothetical protein